METLKELNKKYDINDTDILFSGVDSSKVKELLRDSNFTITKEFDVAGFMEYVYEILLENVDDTILDVANDSYHGLVKNENEDEAADMDFIMSNVTSETE